MPARRYSTYLTWKGLSTQTESQSERNVYFPIWLIVAPQRYGPKTHGRSSDRYQEMNRKRSYSISQKCHHTPSLIEMSLFADEHRHRGGNLGIGVTCSLQVSACLESSPIGRNRGLSPGIKHRIMIDSLGHIPPSPTPLASSVVLATRLYLTAITCSTVVRYGQFLRISQ